MISFESSCLHAFTNPFQKFAIRWSNIYLGWFVLKGLHRCMAHFENLMNSIADKKEELPFQDSSPEYSTQVKS